MKSSAKYHRIPNSFSEDEVLQKPRNKPNFFTTLVSFCLLSVAVLCFIFITKEQSQPKSPFIESVQEVTVKNRPVRRNITSFVDAYFTKEEVEFLNCSAFFNGDADAISAYVNSGRMRLYPERLLEQDMDCESIRHRVVENIRNIRPLKRPIAFARNVYNLYELQEALLSMSYHPDNVFCYVMDIKSQPKFKENMRKMGSCFENTHVLQKEYDFDSSGHGQDKAHYDCLKYIGNKHWDHVILLQNADLVIKTSEQLSNLSDTLQTTSIVGLEIGFPYRYKQEAAWTPASLKLFKNESDVPPEILYRRLSIKKSLNEVVLSKVFVKSILEKLNMELILNLFDDQAYYGVDEMLFNTLYANYLGLEGQMESNCTKQHYDTLSRLTNWDWSGPNGYDKDCKSKFKRHGICLLGVEYLESLKKSRTVLANKVVSKFDFGTVICVREMIKNGTTGETPDASILISLPQFREMQMKASGTYNRATFDC